MTHPRRASFTSSPTAMTSARKRNAPTQVVGLQYESLEKLLFQTLGDYCPNVPLKTCARNEFRKLKANKKNTNVWSLQDLDVLVNLLTQMLDQSPTLPPLQVALVHTCIGLACHQSGQYEAAVTSFLKALWLETSSDLVQKDRLEIGLCLHRLGLAYQRVGDKDSAYNLLGKAIKVYKVSGLKQDHAFVLHAQQEQDFVKTLLRRQKRPWQSTPNISLMPTIQEDGSSPRRHTFNFEKAVTTRITSV